MTERDGHGTGTTGSWEFADGDEITAGRYALRRLGGGKRFEAYLSWDEHLASLVVIKILRPQLVDDGRELRNLATEAEITARLAHPVIVRSFGAKLEGPRPHLMLEHLEGPTLSSLLRRGPLPLEQLLPVALHLCSAAHYMGAESVVHLDIKPRNIIMGAPPRLIDLSVARTFEQARTITGYVGTDQYMAPEQCRPGDGEIGAPADSWGIGASLYRAATNRPPFPRSEDFDASDPEQRFPQLTRAPNPIPTELPKPFVEIVLACLDKEPSARPTATQIAAALEPLVAELPHRPVLARLRPRLRPKGNAR